jgi:tetratricopeptide (TPR) repeat protein
MGGTPATRKLSPSEQIAQLRGQLVLDGLDPAGWSADWAALLRMIATEAAGLRVLASSREPLGLPGEHLHRLGGLLTSPGTPGSLSPAAQLFLREAQRLRTARGGIATDADIEAVARASGGLPLALKLAAAWSRWLEPRSIAQHITLAASTAVGALDGSLDDWLAPVWERLSAPQRLALASLSLSPGSFDMPGAVSLAAAPVDIIELLIDRGLVDLDQGPSPRLHLHALVRAFASARLRAAPVDRRAAIRRYIEGVAARLGPWPVDMGQPQMTVSQVTASLDEVLAAWPLALEVGALHAILWLSAALLTWHEAKGEHRAGERLLVQALPALDESIPTEAAALAQMQIARTTLAYRVGDYDADERLALVTRELALALGAGRIFKRATNMLGLSLWMTPRLDEAKLAFEEGLGLAEAAEDLRYEDVFSSNLALVEKSLGNLAAAESRWRRAIDVRSTRGDWDGVCSSVNNLANLLRHQRRLDECEVLAHECLRLTRVHGLDAERPFALIGLALLLREAGKALQVEAYLALLDACDVDTVEGPVRAGAAQLRAQLALDWGDGDAALIHIGEALDLCVHHGDAPNRDESLALYGDWLSRHDGRPDDALRLWAALCRAPRLHATLRDEIEKRFAAANADPAQMATALDLFLVTEQAMLAARKRLEALSR